VNPLEALFRELEEILEPGFTGQLTLHCNGGRVLKYDVNETRRPGHREQVTLSEGRRATLT
jgi:hypothetical protein